jgi:hypothetical protein
VAAAALRLEQMGRAGDLSGAGDALAVLAAEADRACAAMTGAYVAGGVA